MTGDSLPIVKRMLGFFYTVDYDEVVAAEVEDEPPPATLPTMSPLQLHARVFALADKYDVAHFSVFAHAKYCARLRDFWDPVESLRSVPDVYETTPSSIRPHRDEAARCARIRSEKTLERDDVERFYEDVGATAGGL
ncbi:hypothetical protein LTS18_004019 [Coniosporium uncinatum]|uniref:Uncharacterized protein n=1 Tax=Coniosporium uncinatum TaxID=93489 RepID=A0ACC3DD50_9PEZI|nr:hypothetical protein LTS18_004019 [Coniosporium uncinatum]